MNSAAGNTEVTIARSKPSALMHPIGPRAATSPGLSGWLISGPLGNAC